MKSNKLDTVLIVNISICLTVGMLCLTGCASQRYDSGITVNCGSGGAVAGQAQDAKPGKQEVPAVSNKPTKGSSIQGQEVTPPPFNGCGPQVIIVQNVSGNEGSTSRSTLMDWLRNLFQGAEVPTAIGQTPSATLNSTGKTQTIDNASPLAAGTASTPNINAGARDAVPAATPAVKAGDDKTTPGASAPGG